MRNLLRKLEPTTDRTLEQIVVQIDNQSAISLVQNYKNLVRTKHISLKNHYYREQVDKGKIKV